MITEFGIIIELRDFYFPIEAMESGMLIELGKSMTESSSLKVF
jgi:hypothetical protein